MNQSVSQYRSLLLTKSNGSRKESMPLAASQNSANGVKSHQLCVNGQTQPQTQTQQQQQQQYTEYTTTNIPAFLSKLWTLVEDSKYDQLIAWDPVSPSDIDSSRFLLRLDVTFVHSLYLPSPASAFTSTIRRGSPRRSCPGSSSTTTWPASFAS